MISIKTNGLFDGPFTKLFKDLYIKTSAKPLPSELPYPVELRPYLDTLYGACGHSYSLVDNKFQLRKYTGLDVHDARCLCAFSGGKDSVANVLILRDLGYEPILFFVKGINRSYPQEYDIALALANELQMEIVTYVVNVAGKCDFVENPTKDQFILALMVDYGLKLGILNYSFGCCKDDGVPSISAEYMLSDGWEMFETVELFYQSFIDGFNIVNFLDNETESFYEICKRDWHILDKTFSCMLPLRYREGTRNKNEQKFGISFLPNRCGCSCYKCAQETLILDLLGKKPIGSDLREHCIDILRKNSSRLGVKDMDDFMSEWIDMKYIRKAGVSNGTV